MTRIDRWRMLASLFRRGTKRKKDDEKQSGGDIVIKNKVVGLDIGSGFTKCYDGENKVVFPSVYCYRQPTAWEDESGIIEGVGEKALEIAEHPNTVKLYPIINGKPQYQVFIKIAEEALKRVGVDLRDPVPLVSGLPYETGKQERKEVEALLRKHLSLSNLSIYPQALGTLFDLDLKSGTVINIGHATTELLIIEKLNILGGISEPLARARFARKSIDDV